jgi:hypothetical protein
MKVKTILAVVVLGLVAVRVLGVATTKTVNQSQDLADAASSIGSATREYEAGKQAREERYAKIQACIQAGTSKWDGREYVCASGN